MSQIIEYKIWIVAAVFIFLFVFERIIPAVSVVGRIHPFARVVKNMMFWPLNIILSLLIVLPISYYASSVNLWDRSQWIESSSIAALILDIIILDMFLFFWHRGVHEIKFLWRFHEVHHLDEHLDTTSALRFHFGEVFFSSIVRSILIIACAIPFTSIVIFELLVLTFTLFHHSNLKLNKNFEKAISKIIVTPSIHWVHHHALSQDTDSNYGTIFSFWDHIFHTKSPATRTEDMKIGVEGKKDCGLFSLLVKPFR